MTVIAAAWDGKGQAVIGSDSIATMDGTQIPSGPKIVRRGKWAAGFAGNRRVWAVAKAHEDRLLDHLAGAYDFTLRMRELLREDDWNADTEEGPKSYGQQVVLAHPYGVWSISMSFDICEIPAGMVWADGSGRAYALGAGNAVSGSLEERVRAAIESAVRFDEGCGGAVQMESL